MKVDTFSCDVCGELRKDTNHWFLAFSNFGKPEFTITEVALKVWSEHEAKFGGYVHLCGIECATKFVARELAK